MHINRQDFIIFMTYKKKSLLVKERRSTVRREIIVLGDILNETVGSRVMGLVDRVTSLHGVKIVYSQPVLRGVGAYSRELYGETDDSVPAAVLIDCPRRLCGLWVFTARRNGVPVYEFDQELNRYKPLKRR